MSTVRDLPAGSEPVEEYLDKLLLTLSCPARQVRRTLAEVEAHLHDAVAEELAAGKPQLESEAAAVARLGAVSQISGRPVQFSRPTAALLRRTALAGSLIGGIALVAVAVSGAAGWAMAALRGGTFLVAPFPSGSYTSADCARWLAGDPSTHSCITAMTADHVGEVIVHSFLAGVLGVVALTAYGWMRRRWQDRGTLTALPIGSAEAVGAILAVIVAIGTAGRGLNLEMVQQGQGAGQMFSLSIGALGAAAFFISRLCRLALPSRRPATSAVARPPTG
ncbi:MAG: HAAS signaling domain-containing protein [Streptosporangiaceae bacterium]